jgi:anti-sigma factor RsiW
MSLSDIRSECSDVAGLLQPYVDGELPTDEQERVAEHLGGCKGCRAAVTEQSWVRAALRALPREPAPQAMRAKVLLALDGVDREREAAAPAIVPAQPSLWSRMWSSLADLGRGGLIMVPAGAAAIGLFFVVKDASIPAPSAAGTTNAAPAALGGALSPGTKGTIPAPAASDDDPTAALPQLQPQVGFEPQVPGPAPSPDSVQLVAAGVDGSTANAARLRFELLRRGQPTGHHLIDRQRPADGTALRGELLSVGGREYHLERDAAGAAVLHFVVGSVAHTVRLEGAARVAGDDIVDDAGQRSPADVSALLRFALGFEAEARR